MKRFMAGIYRSRPKAHTRGQALVEFALVLPILIFILMGIVDFGRALFAYSSISNQIRTALRMASVVGVTSSDKTYLNCTAMRAAANDVFFAMPTPIVQIMYLQASSYSIKPTPTPPFNTVYPADKDCTNTAETASFGSTLVNGDILRISTTASVEMVTPFFPSPLTFTLSGQRTLVTSITLVNAPYGGPTDLPLTQTADAADYQTAISGGTGTSAIETSAANAAETLTASAVYEQASATWAYWLTLGITPTPTDTPIYTPTNTNTPTATNTPVLGQVVNLRKWPGGSRCVGATANRYIGLRWNRVPGVTGYYIYANGVLVGKTNDTKGNIINCGTGVSNNRPGRISGCFNLNPGAWVPDTAISYSVQAFKNPGPALGPLSAVLTLSC